MKCGPILVATSLLCAACTLTGLGNYDACTLPPAGAAASGVTNPVATVGDLSVAPSFSNGYDFGEDNLAAPIAAFSSGACVQACSSTGALSSSCFFKDKSPQQPWVVPTGNGYAAAAITTSACPVGRVAFAWENSSGGSGSVQASCETGAALPSVVPSSDGSSAILAWYETSLDSRADPIQNCASAKAVPLKIALVTGAFGSNPSLGSPATLSTTSISVRPPSTTVLKGSKQVLLAAPDGDGVSVWALSGVQVPKPTSLSGFADARAVSIAAANDGSDHIALAAEIGCAPKSIAFAVGTVSGGFGPATLVVDAPDGYTVQPTVAWVPSQGNWIVSWISTSGGVPHALAQRFDSNGNAVGSVVDPSVSSTAAAVGSDGNLLVYETVSGGGSFASLSLGCGQ